MNTRLTDQYSCGYCLSLGDGSNWWITGDEGSLPWINKLAAILELKKCESNGSPRLIFSKLEDGNDVDHVINSLDHAGWICHNERIIRLWYHDSIPDVICEIVNDENDDIRYITMWNSLYPIYRRSISGGGLPFHAGLAELEGRSILIAASGDTGKSTSCSRLPDYWKPLCDDEALVVLDEQKRYLTHPFPTWSDYLWRQSKNTWNVQYSVPLAGVFFLEQAETDEVVPLGSGESAVLISESATQVCNKFWRRAESEDKRRYRSEIFSNACEMAKQIPTFRLRATLHGCFWEEIENVLG